MNMPRLNAAETAALLDDHDAMMADEIFVPGTTLANLGAVADRFDFTDYETRVRLAAQGLFSVDQSAHRAKRTAQAERKATILRAYDIVGLNREDACRRIARHIAPEAAKLGVWVRSTGAYAATVGACDRLTVARAAALQSVA